MSYWVHLRITRPGEYLTETVFSENYTCNCAPMFQAAIGQDGIRTLHGLKASEIVGQLGRAVDHITDPENLEFYKEIEPDNGWGSLDGAIDYLKGIHKACREYPDGVLSVY